MTSFSVQIIFSFAVLSAVAVFVVFKFLGHVWNAHHRNQGGQRIYKLGDGKSITEIADIISGSFSLEVVIHYLGKEQNVYVQAPASAGIKLKELGAEEVDDYSICGTKDTRAGAYFLASEEEMRLSDIDIYKLDFSKVNEVGECAVVQFVFGAKKGSGRAINARVLVAAPSPFQSKEIISNLKKSLSYLRATDARGDSFAVKVCSRDFVENEKILIPT